MSTDDSAQRDQCLAYPALSPPAGLFAVHRFTSWSPLGPQGASQGLPHTWIIPDPLPWAPAVV